MWSPSWYYPTYGYYPYNPYYGYGYYPYAPYDPYDPYYGSYYCYDPRTQTYYVCEAGVTDLSGVPAR